MDRQNKRNILLAISALLLLGVLMPALVPQYQLRLVTEALIFSLFALSYNMLLGYAGLLSFGHAMFFGTGAFAVAIILNNMTGVPFLVVVLMATCITTVIGLGVGLLLLRVSGTPFALLTLAFNALFYSIGVKWSSVTGGDDGLMVDTPPIDMGFFVINPYKGPGFYYVTLAVIGACIFFCWYFSRTAMGQSVLLLRDNEERMRFLGYDAKVTRLILFTTTAGLAGVAGAFYALFNSFIALDAISTEMTTKVLLMTFIGGTGHFIGPVLGTFFYTFVQDFMSDLTENWPMFMGILFISMVLFAPGGLAGIGESLLNRMPGRKGNKAGVARQEGDE